jgi:hypothetical protein
MIGIQLGTPDKLQPADKLPVNGFLDQLVKPLR